MVSPLAKGDYDDMISAGLKPTLEDFDRLNCLALRLTNGTETTVANFPRIGWAGDIPFYQPTCAAFAWYLQFVERAEFEAPLKDACWFYALAHGRDDCAFYEMATPRMIRESVERWLKTLPVTRDEIARACRYAAVGFDDAVPGKTDAQIAADARKTDEDRREESLANLDENISAASALTGVAPDALMAETPSRLAKMVEAVRANNPMGGGAQVKDNPRARAEYDLAYREIRRRLLAERARDLGDRACNGADGGRDAVHNERGDDAGPQDGEAKPA